MYTPGPAMLRNKHWSLPLAEVGIHLTRWLDVLASRQDRIVSSNQYRNSLWYSSLQPVPLPYVYLIQDGAIIARWGSIMLSI